MGAIRDRWKLLLANWKHCGSVARPNCFRYANSSSIKANGFHDAMVPCAISAVNNLLIISSHTCLLINSLIIIILIDDVSIATTARSTRYRISCNAVLNRVCTRVDNGVNRKFTIVADEEKVSDPVNPMVTLPQICCGLATTHPRILYALY